MAKVPMGFRQIHLDFHTSPFIPDVGAEFDAAKFAATVKAANVDSVTVFAKCHHGHLYYNTNHPARHPSLPKGMDLLRQQVDALHKVGVRAPIYLSVQCDEYAANTHPEWIVRQADGMNRGPNPLQAGWQILDMSSPYYEYLEAQTREVMEKFTPVDGIFFDMCWNQPSVSNWAKAKMLATGLDPANEADRNEYARRVALDYIKKLSAIVRSYGKNVSVYFNSRPMTLLNQDLPYMTHVEVEALPTGGWGYTYFPMNVRYVRGFGVPYLGMTARFHKSWADFGGLKPEPALKYEICQMLAHGAKLSIGDQLHPRGGLDTPAWDMIGRVYGHAGQCQPWCEDATSAAEIALMRAGEAGYMVSAGGVNEGATRMLMQLKHQFDVVDEKRDLAGYKLLVLPDVIPVDEKLGQKIHKFVQGGGKVLITGRSGLDASGKPLCPGIPIAGEAAESPFGVTYVRPTAAAKGALPDMNSALYEKGLRVTAAKGAEVLAKVVEPYFERGWRHFCSHNQTPPAKATQFPVALVKGAVAYIPYPIFSTYGMHGSLICRQLVQMCIGRLIGKQMVQIDAPSFAEVSVMTKGKATVVHVLSWSAERRATNMDIVEDTVPLHDVKLSVALAKKPAKAYLAPSREAVDFTYADGRADLTIPRVDGHQMVVFE